MTREELVAVGHVGYIVLAHVLQAGHAEWVADMSGKPQFKWKECK